MDDVRLANFFAGREIEPGPIEAWRADHWLARALGVRLGEVVLLSYDNFVKSMMSHPEITFAEYMLLPKVFSEGFIYRGSRRSAVICYFDTGKPLKVVAKATRYGEIYIKTVHRIGRDEVKRLFKGAERRGAVIRGSKAELARQLLRRASST
jgi:hypothetical protein